MLHLERKKCNYAKGTRSSFSRNRLISFFTIKLLRAALYFICIRKEKWRSFSFSFNPLFCPFSLQCFYAHCIKLFSLSFVCNVLPSLHKAFFFLFRLQCFYPHCIKLFCLSSVCNVLPSLHKAFFSLFRLQCFYPQCIKLFSLFRLQLFFFLPFARFYPPPPFLYYFY